ncbi:hypothetical protein HELRODRAFT_183936 [Helobdella robusta]|uniref:Cystatin domain-containing protein n=1 Tax=Helobdella robusta TaxID=6412 RepID=T1FKB6_HELRO|nr:hypothetical protein HELRODRAFT_183936 [Helobdella robusta]ESO09718.1 hypothetical protein HELRODRAFT_183936 [Helobdella robusta]
MQAAIIVFASCVLAVLSVGIPGGWIDADVESEDVIQAAEKSIQLFDQSRSDNVVHNLLKVISAKTQVVAGINYDLVVQVGLIDCLAGDLKTDVECVKKTGVCSFRLFVQSWTNTNELHKISCKADD